MNKIIHGDCLEVMKTFEDNTIDMMITSPPYNVGKEYESDLDINNYRAMLINVWEEVYRVLVNGGRACINIANTGRKPYIPLHSFIIEDMLKIGFLMRGEIIWNKSASVGSSTAWGSWKSASNPILRDVHEYILVFSKVKYGIDVYENTITKDEFLEYTKSIWTFNTVSAKKIGHPAPFPLELPERLIKLYSFVGDFILDPFAGSGTTGLACANLNRNYILIEKEKEYYDIIKKRIDNRQLALI